MFRFFRQIRHKLLLEGRVSKYIGYAVGEIALIVVGVSLALFANDWHQKHSLKLDEIEIIKILLEDLERDSGRHDRWVERLAIKKEALNRVKTVYSSGSPSSKKSFLEDIILGAEYGWFQGTSLRTAYDELISSGRLSVIRDEKVRSRLASYYKQGQNIQERIEERETEYPNLTYQIAPRDSRHVDGGGFDEELSPELTEEEVDEFVALALEIDLVRHINAEMNFATYMENISRPRHDFTLRLLDFLTEYLNELEN